MKKFLILFAGCLISSTTLAAALGWNDVLQSVETHYPLIKAAQQDIFKAKSDYLAAQGAFDPALNSAYISSPTGGYIYRYYDTSLEVPTTFRGVEFFSGYRRGTGNFPIYDNYYETNDEGEIRAGVRVPLLRNSAIDAQRAKLNQATLNIALQQQNFILSEVDAVKNAGYAYWDWVGEGQRVKIFQHLLSLAQQRQNALNKRLTLGDAAKIEVIENQRLVVERKIALMMAERSLQQSAYVLSLFYRDRFGRPYIPLANQLPAYLPLPPAHFPMQLTELPDQQTFILHHPLVERLAKAIQIDQIAVHLNKNRYLPELDTLFYAAKDYGVGNPLLEPTSYNVELQFHLPLLMRQARGETNAALNRLYRLYDQEQLAEEQVSVALREALNQLQMTWQQIHLTQQELQLVSQVQTAETTRFSHGDGSIFLLNQREQATAETQTHLVAALIAFQKSRIDLWAACGLQTACLKI